MKRVNYYFHRFGRRLLPVSLKGWFRRHGWFRHSDSIVWELPAPMSGYVMTGPGVFGTYVDRSYEKEVG